MNNNLEEYFKIRFENKIALRPRREDCHLAAATRILVKRNEVDDADKELDNCKEWYKEKMAEIAAGRDALADKEKALKKQMLKYETFLRDNDSKRHRGERKAKEEHKTQAKKNYEMNQMQEELKKLEERRTEMQEAVNRNAKFRDFLLTAIEADSDYEDINDLLSRCDVLWATQRDLLERDQCDQLLLDQETLGLITSSEHLNAHVLRLNNLISEMHMRYEHAQNHALATENRWTRIKNTAAKQTLHLGQVKIGMLNLYRLCWRYRQSRALDHEELVELTDPAEQLDMVIEVMEDIKAVYRECCRRARQADKAPTRVTQSSVVELKKDGTWRSSRTAKD